MDSPPATPVYAVPIAQRRPMPWTMFFKAILFTIVFDIGCLMINGCQFIFFLPLRILPFRWAKDLYNSGIRYTKGAFGCLQSVFCSFLSQVVDSLIQFVITQFSCANGSHPQNLSSHLKERGWALSHNKISTNLS